MSIETFLRMHGRPCQFILRNRRGEILDRADAEIDAHGRLTVRTEQDQSCYASFSAWRAARTSYANTYDMIATEDGVLLRTIANDGRCTTQVGDEDGAPDRKLGLPTNGPFRYRLYHGHTPLEYLDYLKRALFHDLQRHADLVRDWPEVASRALREAVKAHIRFQYGLRWADKTQPCLYRERDCITAVDRGDQTEMDHVIRVAELADAVLRENLDFKRCFATLVRAWLCPVAHITGASHDLLGAGLHPDHEHPFARYARVNLSAEDHEGKDVTELTLYSVHVRPRKSAGESILI